MSINVHQIVVEITVAECLQPLPLKQYTWVEFLIGTNRKLAKNWYLQLPCLMFKINENSLKHLLQYDRVVDNLAGDRLT